MIQTTDLTKEFNGITAVDRLTLEIAPGEVFGFLGPNGAGKTTTVRMLTALIAPTAGEARVLGYKIGEDNQAIRRRVGILTETPGLYDRLTARRNLTIYANLYEVDHIDRQVEKYLRMFGLWQRADDPAGTFSKGMRQKLAIARAMLHEPEILFLDEPTAGLDPEAARLVRDAIVQLRGEGRTIFICTHNLDEADRLCDRVAVFKSRLRVVDAPARLRSQVYGRRIAVHLANSAEPFVDAVATISAVADVEAVDNKLIVQVSDPERDNPDLIRALVAAGAPIQFVGEVRHTLEDVYLQVMRSESEEGAA